MSAAANIYRSDVSISATHRLWMDEHEPALRWPGYVADDLCDIVYYPEIEVSALAFRVRRGEDRDLPAVGEEPLTIVDAEALPHAVLVAGSTGIIYLAPRPLLHLSRGLLPALYSLTEEKLQAAYAEYQRLIGQLLAHTPHDLAVDEGSLAIHLGTAPPAQRARSARLDIQAISAR